LIRKRNVCEEKGGVRREGCEEKGGRKTIEWLLNSSKIVISHHITLIHAVISHLTPSQTI
jgi:hypothetical protein